MPDKPAIETIARKRTRRSYRPWIVVALVVLAGAGVWYWFLRGDQARAVSYVTAPVTIADLTVTVNATGTIEPVNTVEVSSELSGIIREVHADFNDIVKAGDILANLDTDRLEASIARMGATLAARNASVAEAQVTLDETSDNYDRALQLSERGISSQESLLTAKAEHERARAALETAKANVTIAEADLRAAEIDLEKACICAPVDGIVLDRAVEPGQVVAASLQAPTLFTLAEDLKHMDLKVDIDEADIGKVAVGNTAHFTVEAYQDRKFTADIVQVRYASETIDGVVTYKAVLEVDNADLLLRPGMTATAGIVVAELSDVLTVPNAALRFSPPVEATEADGGGSGLLGMIMPSRNARSPAPAAATGSDGMRSVWTLRDGAALEVSVRTGSTDGSQTQILEGELKEGDRVITELHVTG